jgi:hypothetical protein
VPLSKVVIKASQRKNLFYSYNFSTPTFSLTRAVTHDTCTSEYHSPSTHALHENKIPSKQREIAINYQRPFQANQGIRQKDENASH